jgi:DNA-directed RNA polymerase subunit RPC12/RpoP
MQLSYLCSSCKTKNYIKTRAKNRFELQTEFGDEISRHCTHCGTFEKKHINRLFASPSKFMGFFCLGLAIVLTATIFMFGFIATLTFTIPIWIYFDAYKKASDFNKIMVARKQPSSFR